MVRDDFSALLDDELSSAERERIEEHLSDCADCLRALNRFKRVDDAYAGLGAVSAPEGFEEAVRTALRPKQVRRFPMRPVVGTLLAAAAAVLIVVTVWPRTAVAPEDGSFQVSKSAEDAARAEAPQAPAAEPEPAERESAGRAEAGAETADVGTALDDEAANDGAVRQQPEFEVDALSDGRMPNVSGGERGLAGESRRSVDMAPTIGWAPMPSEAAETEDVVVRRRSGSGAESLAPTEGFGDSALEKSEADAVERSQQNESMLSRDADSTKEALEESMSSASGAEQVAAAPSEPPGPAVSEARTFEVRDGVWYETGYAGETIVDVERDGEILQALIEADPRVAELAENASRIVFEVGGVWYGLAARE